MPNPSIARSLYARTGCDAERKLFTFCCFLLGLVLDVHHSAWLAFLRTAAVVHELLALDLPMFLHHEEVSVFMGKRLAEGKMRHTDLEQLHNLVLRRLEVQVANLLDASAEQRASE